MRYQTTSEEIAALGRGEEIEILEPMRFDHGTPPLGSPVEIRNEHALFYMSARATKPIAAVMQPVKPGDPVEVEDSRYLGCGFVPAYVHAIIYSETSGTHYWAIRVGMEIP